jgi:hypothetical protein
VPYTVLAMMRIYVIYKCLSWDGDQQQELGKPNKKQPGQAIDGKLLGIPSHVVREKIQCTLRKEQGWTHMYITIDH